MTKNAPAKGQGPTAAAANDPGALKAIGGSQSDRWNTTLANQVMQAMWVEHLDASGRHTLRRATIAALAGIAPRDELEGMMAAQLIAAHNAAMECYRRAMIGDQTFEGRRENLNQANKLSRTSTMLLDVFEQASRKGSPEGHGRARSRSRWRTSGGRKRRETGGGGSRQTVGTTPCKG